MSSSAKSAGGPITAFYSRRQVVERTTLSATTLWRMVRRGEFPAPVQLSAIRKGWPKEAVDGWIAARANPQMGAA
jgi:prophage regulatory protein